MKNILAVLLLAVNLQTQGQVFSCDTLTPTYYSDFQSDSNLNWMLTNPNLDSIFPYYNFHNLTTDNNIYWVKAWWERWNMGSYAIESVNDTLVVCYDIPWSDTMYLDTTGIYYDDNCCDTLTWTNLGWSIMSATTGVNEIKITKHDDMVYDMLGREIVGDIPKNTMYIKNRRTYVKIN